VKLFLIFFFGCIFQSLIVSAQVPDTAKNSSFPKDSISQSVIRNPYQRILDSVLFLNTKAVPTSLNIIPKNRSSNQVVFYFIAFLFLLFALVKTFFAKYFTTLFAVFFNTSIRQNQLTDQLKQATLPSLIFNILFVLAVGAYIFVVTQFFMESKKMGNDLYTINYFLLLIAGVGICYLVKYFILSFIGWLTNSEQEFNIYLFITFLLNKVLGIFLLAIVPIIAFGSNKTASYAVLFSLIGIALIFLLRYFRSYALLQTKLKVSGFHFLLYSFALELLPLAIIFKFCMLFFRTNA
jgi:hypothetical protein